MDTTVAFIQHVPLYRSLHRNNRTLSPLRRPRFIPTAIPAERPPSARSPIVRSLQLPVADVDAPISPHCRGTSPCPDDTIHPASLPIHDTSVAPLKPPQLPPTLLARLRNALATPRGRAVAVLLTLSALRLLHPALAPHLPRLPAASSLVATFTAHARDISTSRATLLLGVTNFFTVLLCFPANMGLMVTAGAILPPLNAVAALFVSKLLAACTAYALARTLLLAHAQRWLRRHPRLSAVSRSGVAAGWRFVLAMRLSPFPGFVLNYLLSLTGISFSQYVIGTVLGIVPSIANLVLIGNAAKEVGVGVVQGGIGVAWLPLLIKLLCVVSMLVVSVYSTKAMTKAFRDAGEDLHAVAEGSDDGLDGQVDGHADLVAS